MSFPDQADLQRVTDEVNAMPYVADPTRYEQAEWWERIDADGGDCEDYALTKLQRLRALGWPIERLRLATCYVETGEYHAVLAVDLPDGTQVVMDNRQHQPQNIEALERLRYTPDKIQRTGGSRDWAHWIWKHEEGGATGRFPGTPQQPVGEQI